MKSQETITRLVVLADIIQDKLDLSQDQRETVYDILLDYTSEDLTHYDMITSGMYEQENEEYD